MSRHALTQHFDFLWCVGGGVVCVCLWSWWSSEAWNDLSLGPHFHTLGEEGGHFQTWNMDHKSKKYRIEKKYSKGSNPVCRIRILSAPDTEFISSRSGSWVWSFISCLNKNPNMFQIETCYKNELDVFIWWRCLVKKMSRIRINEWTWSAIQQPMLQLILLQIPRFLQTEQILK